MIFNENTSLLTIVRAYLWDYRGQWRKIHEATGIDYNVIARISSGTVKDPGVSKVETLYWFFQKLDAAVDNQAQGK